MCEEYEEYVITKYCGNSVIVLDGYVDLANSTKSHEHLLRCVTSREIQFELHMKTITTQEAFFSNRANKQRLHDALKPPHLSAKGITVKQARSDADALIVFTALQTAETTHNSVVVLGNDTDLMAMLSSQADPSYDNFLMVEINPPLFYKISAIQSKYDRQHCQLFFLHYFTGSDTTSAFYNKGKKIGYNCFLKMNGDNLDKLNVFLDGNSNADDIARAVDHFALQMYGAKVSCSVHKLRYLTYDKAIGNSNLSTSFKLECLPPTSAALRQHSYRTYHAVQQALGRSLPALDWGWMNQNDIGPTYASTY